MKWMFTNLVAAKMMYINKCCLVNKMNHINETERERGLSRWRRQREREKETEKGRGTRKQGERRGDAYGESN